MKIVISGYYGFDNSGDDALLMSIIDNLKKNDEKAEITVLSKNPQKTAFVMPTLMWMQKPVKFSHILTSPIPTTQKSWTKPLS